MLEQRYAGRLAGILPGFKQSARATFIFRCPFCGDSKKNKHKARGYLFCTSDNKMLFKCHNCGMSKGFQAFLKEINADLYREYLYETLSSKNDGTITESPLERQESVSFDSLTKIIDLSPSHPARSFLEARKIPHREFWRLYYADNFGKFSGIDDTSPRVIIPLIDENHLCKGYLGRAIEANDKTLRYVNIIVDKSQQVIYGADRLDTKTTFFVTEGAFDAMFLPNAVATLSVTKRIPYNVNAIYVLDNEPRNKEVVKAYDNRIASGDRIFIWPDTIKAKDINDWVLTGIDDPTILVSTIMANSYSGLEAKLRLSDWRKCS